MIILGLILLVLGYFLGFQILYLWVPESRTTALTCRFESDHGQA